MTEAKNPSISFQEPRSTFQPHQDTATHAKQVASHVASETKSLMTTEVTRRTGQSADELGKAAQALRETGQKLEGNIASPYVTKAADQLDRAASYLRTASFGEVMRGVEDFARREPLVFLGGAFAIGLMGARLLRGTAPMSEDVQSHGDVDLESRPEIEYGRSMP